MTRVPFYFPLSPRLRCPLLLPIRLPLFIPGFLHPPMPLLGMQAPPLAPMVAAAGGPGFRVTLHPSGDGDFLIPSIADIIWLRQEHRIVSQLAGTLAIAPSQSSSLSTPGVLSRTQGRFLFAQGLARIPIPTPITESDFPEAAGYIFHWPCYVRFEREFANAPVVPCSDWPSSQPCTSQSHASPLPLLDHEDARYLVFRHLALTCGLTLTASGSTRFGGDFLAYTADPLSVHAEYIVLIVGHQAQGGTLPAEKLIAAGRLANSTKKAVLLCSVVASAAGPGPAASPEEAFSVSVVTLRWSKFR
ncbi:hypothetical protein H696_04996 [Fonticula alba]|uniref:tRNA-intron lyase n=1 Tax=Fonticula alba TaxID=691883 RepID=A0A058Z453_FONAL|nr:hypothetical protein H696_04996 [Fonticula alba]KCV68708.1 hypothetical protein H696_04996 [Fonticula alba]|eukprot:XP_009497140.1 hypothetical protein H696_04996 [Fonticula alba]